MSLPAPLLFLALWSSVSGASTPLATVGEQLGESTVIDLVDHPEFHRIIVQLPDKTELTVEVVATDAALGACTHHGFAIQPRWELLDKPGQTVENQPPVVRELCARLEAEPPLLKLSPPPGEGQDPPDRESGSDDPPPHRPQPASSGSSAFHPVDGPAAPAFRPLHAVIAGCLLILLVVGPLTWRRQRLPSPSSRRAIVGGLLAVTGIGLVARVVLGLHAPLWSPMFGFGRLAMVLGAFEPVSGYGDGYTSTLTAITAVFGAHTSTIFWGNLALGALLPSLLWGTVRALVPERPVAASGAALLAALLPVHVWFSASEAMHVSLLTWEILAILAAAWFLREAPRYPVTGFAFATASALATVMAVHTRPEALPFALAPALLVLLHTRRAHLPGIVVASTFISLGVVLRLAEMAFDVSDEAVAVNYELLWNPDTWRVLLMPDPGMAGPSTMTSVLMRFPLTSPLIPLLALLGLWKAPRTLTTALVAWWALAIIPVLPKAWPLADAWRLQAASLLPVLILAGIGFDTTLCWLRDRRPAPSSRLLPVHGLLGLLVLPQLFLERPTWGTLEESRLLLQATPNLPPEATVLFDDTHTHADAVASWGAYAAPGTHWRSIQNYQSADPTDNPLVAWLGSSCHDLMLTDGSSATTTGCAWLRSHCTLTPLAVESIEFTSDIDREFAVEAGEVGFYRLSDCTVPSSETEPTNETTQASPPDAPE